MAQNALVQKFSGSATGNVLHRMLTVLAPGWRSYRVENAPEKLKSSQMNITISIVFLTVIQTLQIVLH